MAILKPQTSNPVYHYNCQGNCILFYENNLCKNKEAEIGQKQTKKKKKILRVESSNTENYNNSHLYFFQKFAYLKKCHIHTIHNQTPKLASKM